MQERIASSRSSVFWRNGDKRAKRNCRGGVCLSLGEKMHMHMEPVMMHCYASAPVFRESKRDFGKQIALLRQI